MITRATLQPFYKPSTGIGRGHGKRKASGGGAAHVTDSAPAEQPPKAAGYSGTTNVVEMSVDTSRPEALSELAEMAKRGEVPSAITGSREDKARWLEEFDRLYGEPPGELGKYKTEAEGLRRLDIRFEHTYLSGGVEPYAMTANYLSSASKSEVSGAVKYAIYKQRGVLEQAMMYRVNGWPTVEMREKYGAPYSRVFSSAEKTRIDREIRDYVEGQMKSPLSRAGEKYAEVYWRRSNDGWVRTG